MTLKKFRNKIKNEIFEQCHSVKGDPSRFLTFILLQNIETNEGRILWCNPKIFKKVSQCRKKTKEKHQDSQRGILSMFSRFWTSVLPWARF